MTTKTVYIDHLVVTKIARLWQMIEAGTTISLYGIELNENELIICMALTAGDHVAVPIGNVLKLVSTIDRKITRNENCSLDLHLSKDNSGAILLTAPNHNSIVKDTRDMIRKHFIPVIANIHGYETHFRLKNSRGFLRSQLVATADAEVMSQTICFTDEDDMIFMESFIDTENVSLGSDSLRINGSTRKMATCALLSRKVTLGTLRDILKAPALEGEIVYEFDTPFPVKVNSIGKLAFPRLWIHGSGVGYRNVHYDVNENNPDDAVMIRDGYDFYHYGVDGYDDIGWGCAYRAIQTLASWFSIRYNIVKDVPSVEMIQTILKHHDYAHSDIRIGSRTWIGCVEANTVFSVLSDDMITCRIMHANSQGALTELLIKEAYTHLHEIGSPIMVGAGDYAYVIGGVSLGTSSVLILDPHYTGKNAIQKCAWKQIETFMDFKRVHGSFINILFPQVLIQVE
jgi:hypothetical protein